MLYDELRKHIAEQIRETTGWPVYFNRADEKAERPYVSFDLMETLGEDYRHNYSLQVDFWDTDDVKRIIDKKSRLDKAWKRYLANEETFVLSIYQGSLGQMVEDDDRRVRHYARSYEVAAYSKEGE